MRQGVDERGHETSVASSAFSMISSDNFRPSVSLTAACEQLGLEDQGEPLRNPIFTQRIGLRQ